MSGRVIAFPLERIVRFPLKGGFVDLGLSAEDRDCVGCGATPARWDAETRAWWCEACVDDPPGRAA